MLPSSLHSLSRNNPELLAKIDFVPPHSKDFSRAGCCQYAKFKRLGSQRIALAKLGNKLCKFLIGHRGVMAPAELRTLGQKMIEMSAPPSRVLTLTKSIGLGGIQNLLNAAAKP